MFWTICTCDNIEASFVKGAHEQLKPDDRVDDDDEEDEEGDVHQGDDCHQDGIHHNLQTCATKLYATTNPTEIWRRTHFNQICDQIEKFLLGTPEISLRGRNTLKARRAFTSKPSICKTAKIELTNLARKEVLGRFTFDSSTQALWLNV